MGRIDQRLVGKRQKLVVQGVVKMCAQIVGGPPERSPQVGTADIADKQSIAGENGVRLYAVFLEIEDQDRNGLDRMAGSFENLEPQPRELQRIAVLHRHESVF